MIFDVNVDLNDLAMGLVLDLPKTLFKGQDLSDYWMGRFTMCPDSENFGFNNCFNRVAANGYERYYFDLHTDRIGLARAFETIFRLSQYFEKDIDENQSLVFEKDKKLGVYGFQIKICQWFQAEFSKLDDLDLIKVRAYVIGVIEKYRSFQIGRLIQGLEVTISTDGIRVMLNQDELTGGYWLRGDDCFQGQNMQNMLDRESLLLTVIAINTFLRKKANKASSQVSTINKEVELC